MNDRKQGTSAKKLMVIDTDAGVDDALAIMLAFCCKDEWEILGITCCHGNTKVGNVCQNVLKILVEYNEKEIPVYAGCEESLVFKYPYGCYHGEDGFGNVADRFTTGDLEVSEEHAVNALTRLARDHPQQITLVALGPLTNIAMAHRMDPQFTKNLEGLFLMGGNVHGVGNVTNAAEFNFLCDPESAHIVLTESSCPVCMVPWETTMNHGMDWELFWKWMACDTLKGKFVKQITAYMVKCFQESNEIRFIDCDFLVVAAAIRPEAVAETICHPVSVETSGKFARGQAIIERLATLNDETRARSIKIITRFDDSILNELRYKIVQS